MMFKRHLSKAHRARQIVNFEYRCLRVIDCRSNRFDISMTIHFEYVAKMAEKS